MPTTPELDVRLYTKAGLRIRLPSDWITAVDFELVERGGCGNATVTVEVPWDVAPGGIGTLVGTEYVDIRLWGGATPLYRGWVRKPEAGIEVPERLTLNCFGLMETLNNYQCTADIILPVAQTVDIPFNAVLANWVTTSGRLPTLVINTTGVAALGIDVQVLSSNQKSVREAIDALCDLSPGLLIWTCDVDASTGLNRINLLPRATATGYRYSIGGSVEAYVYPRDVTSIVNRLFVTGAKADRQLTTAPNLMPNASFEQQATPGLTTSNLLGNGGFETQGVDAFHFQPWTNVSSASSIGSASTTDPVFEGSSCLSLATAGIYQILSASSGLTWNLSAQFCEQIGGGYSATTRIGVDLLNSSGGILYTHNGPWVALTADNIYRAQSFSYTPPVNAAIAQIKVRIENDGTWLGQQPLVDAISLWDTAPSQKCWEVGAHNGGVFTAVDWIDPSAAVDGFYGVTVQPAVSSSGPWYYDAGEAGTPNALSVPYAELKTRFDSRVSISSGESYWFSGYISNNSGSDGTVQIGARFWKSDGTLKEVYVSPVFTVPHGVGFVPMFPATGGAAGGYPLYTTYDTEAIDLFVHFLDNRNYSIDALGLWETPPPDYQASGLYYPADTITAIRDVNQYVSRVVGLSPQPLSAGAALSITDFGEREGRASSDLVVDTNTLDAFCVGYFNATAVPIIQARLSLNSATAPQGFDALVQLINISPEPPALAASKVRYSIGDAIKIDCDLGQEIPDMALLLRATVREGTQIITAG
jgi:hypothetical protein